MATRTSLTLKQLRNAVFDQTKLEALQTKLAEHDTAITAVEDGTTSSVITIHPADGATTGNIADLTACPVLQDGVTHTAGKRLFLRAQTNAQENGIYVFGTVATGNAPLTRATDWDIAAEIKAGTFVVVTAGTVGASGGPTIWQLTGDFPMTVGTSHQHFTQIYNNDQASAVGRAVYKKTVTIKDEDLSGSSQVVNVGTALPTNAVVLAHDVIVAEQFSGLSDVTIKIGGTDDDAIVAATDLDALAIGSYQCTLGTHPKGVFSAQQLTATVVSAGGNLTDLTTGEVAVNVWYITLA